MASHEDMMEDLAQIGLLCALAHDPLQQAIHIINAQSCEDRHSQLPNSELELFKYFASHDEHSGLSKLDNTTARDIANLLCRIWYAGNIIFAGCLRSGIMHMHLQLLRNTGYLLNQLGRCLRAFAFRASNETHYPLPDFKDLAHLDLSTLQEGHSPMVTAARIFWLENRKQSGLELYPQNDRYQPLNTNAVVLRNNLSEHHQHLLRIDWLENQCWIEWSLFRELAGYLTICKPKLDGQIQQAMQDWHEDPHATQSPHPAVDSYTTECTQEAMASEEPRCFSCYYNFGPTFSDSDITEPAVKTRCNHVIGRLCCDRWVQEGHSNCPVCRQPLFGFELTLPQGCRAAYRRLNRISDEIKLHDEQIDKYLVGGPVNFVGEESDRFIWRIFYLARDFLSTKYDFVVDWNREYISLQPDHNDHDIQGDE